MARMQHHSLVAVMVLVLGMLFAGTSSQAGERFTLGVCVMGERHPYFRDMLDQITVEAKRVGVAVIPGNADFNHERQVGILDGYIRDRVSLIIVAPYDARALVPTLEKAGQAGIPVMTVDAAVGGYATISHVASDNIAGGRLAAGMLLERLEEKGIYSGCIVVLDHIGVTSTYQRVKGFRDVMALRGSTYTLIVADGRGETDIAAEKTLRVMESLGDELVGAFASNDGMSVGALSTVRDLPPDRREKMVLVGYDDTEELRAAVDSEEMAGIVVQFPRSIGKRAFEIAYQSLINPSSKTPLEDLIEVGTYSWEGLVDQRGNVIEPPGTAPR
ncbi:MAG: sugar ABC transporter substrate-binding protein [Planctomycetaceae bacterium]|nr:sugar ABC transporter substrate-binding protein [Planctomycetaceae bacterium]